MKKRRKKVNMLEGNLLENVILFALPVIASGIMQLLFNAIDMVVVGKYSGNASMAAVSSTGALINLVTNMFIGLSIGTSVTVAKRIGAGDNKKVTLAVHTSITVALVAGVVLTVFGVLFSRPLLVMMKSPDDVIDLSSLYLKVYFTGMLATMVYNFGSAVLRAKGDTKKPLYALTVAGILNALLNLFFVITLKMDVAGVGLASSISSYVSAGMIIYALVHETDPVKLNLRKLSIDKESLIDIAKVGIPSGIQGTVFSLSNVVIQSSVNEFGKITMAGNGAAASIEGFVYNAMNAFYQTCMTFTSQNLGAGKVKRIKKILATCQLCVIVTGLIAGLGAYAAGDFLLGLYSDDPAVIAAGFDRMYYVGRIYFICGIMDVFVGALRGMGASVGPMIVALLGACAFRLVWIATYFQAHHTINNLYISYPLSWIITGFVHFLTFLFVYRRACKRVNNESL
ncbi:MAG: MATE family efflux transporter [Lachnospiraceae bacterium]|nr:MATE family efflux transporter [Lachnospiraceae bacterium]